MASDENAASLNLADGVNRHADERPSAPALSIEGRVWTYGELRTGAARVAARLEASLAAGRTRRVGILASRSLATYAGILGAAWAGGTYVPLNPKQPAARLASILRRAGLDAIVVDAAGGVHLADEAVRSVLPACVLRDVEDAGSDPDAAAEVPATKASDSPRAVAPDHPAYVMFTSGTTGVPKGVVVTAANVAHFLSVVRRRYAIGPGDRVGQFCETSFDVSVFEMFAAWDGGACLCVVPDAQLLAPAGFLRREAITVWTSVPSVIAMLARMKLLEPGLFPALRASFFIGEALPVPSALAWQAAAPSSVVDNQYGPTEATVACAVQRLGDSVVETPGRGTVAIGLPYDGMHAAIVEDGEFLSDGSIGELALSGPQLAACYLDDAEQTARRFPTLEHPALGLTRWYLTGDFAFRDSDGILHCLGRTDHQVKIMGHRVELEDLEAHLRAASGTDAVAAVARPAAGGTATTLAAFVSGAAKSPAEIRERLRELVPPYMLPRRVVALDALPLSTNGKVDRHALVALLDETS